LPDRLNHEHFQKKPDKPNTQTDIFDVVKKDSFLKRGTILIVPEETVDIEAAKTVRSTLELDESNAVYVSLVPRATVIDSTYHKKPDVEVQQNILDRKMQKKAMQDLDIDSDNESVFSRSGTHRVSIISKARSTRTSKTSKYE
jgi:hypothetical protein